MKMSENANANVLKAGDPGKKITPKPLIAVEFSDVKIIFAEGALDRFAVNKSTNDTEILPSGASLDLTVVCVNMQRGKARADESTSSGVCACF